MTAKRAAALAFLTAATWPLIAATTAHAGTHRCNGDRYYDLRVRFPAIYDLKATDVPELTSDYAPRCQVAEWIADKIQDGFENRQRFPRRMRVAGKYWDAGRWTCTYENRQGRDNPYQHATCRKAGHSNRRVTMDLTS